MTIANNGQQKPDRRWLWVWYGIAAVVVAFDLVTKSLATEALALYDRVSVLPFFDITLRHNYGAAFSFLAGEGGWQVWFFGILAGVVSLGIAAWIAKIGSIKSLEVLGLALILGGAVGNLYDRVTLGYVVDFILVYYQDYQFPAFNIADSAITIGAGVLLLDAFFGAKKSKQENNDEVKNVEAKIK